MIGAYFVSKARTDDMLTHAFAMPAQVAIGMQTVSLLVTFLLLDETISAKKVRSHEIPERTAKSGSIYRKSPFYSIEDRITFPGNTLTIMKFPL